MGSYAFNVCLTCECAFISYILYVSYELCKLFVYAHHQNDSFPNTRSKYAFGIIAPFVLESISNYDSAKLYDFHFGSDFVYNDLQSSSCIAL